MFTMQHICLIAVFGDCMDLFVYTVYKLNLAECDSE